MITTSDKWRTIQAALGGIDVDGDPRDQTADAVALLMGIKFEEAAQVSADGIPGLIVSIAKAEVGVREEPKDSNRGKRVQEYQAATWLDGTGWPWCAAFVDWVLLEALGKYAGKVEWKRPRTAGAWDLLNWAEGQSGSGVAVYNAVAAGAEAGDILVYNFSHCGLAVADQLAGRVKTVEGNTDETGGREGGGVYLRSRKISEIRAIIRIS